MTYTIKIEQENPLFLDALKKFVAQWQGVKINQVEEVPRYITDEEILADPETLEAMKECEYILAHPDEFKKFGSAREMFEDIFSE